MPRKQRQNNQPMGGQQTAPQLPPIPSEVRSQFPMLRNKYPQLSQLNDDQMWLYLLQLRQQQIQQQQMAAQQGMQQQRAPSAIQAKYGSGMVGGMSKKDFNGVSSGLFENGFFK